MCHAQSVCSEPGTSPRLGRVPVTALDFTGYRHCPGYGHREVIAHPTTHFSVHSLAAPLSGRDECHRDRRAAQALPRAAEAPWRVCPAPQQGCQGGVCRGDRLTVARLPLVPQHLLRQVLPAGSVVKCYLSGLVL